LALEGIRSFGKSIRNLVKSELMEADRENLLYVSPYPIDEEVISYLWRNIK